MSFSGTGGNENPPRKEVSTPFCGCFFCPIAQRDACFLGEKKSSILNFFFRATINNSNPIFLVEISAFFSFSKGKPNQHVWLRVTLFVRFSWRNQRNRQTSYATEKEKSKELGVFFLSLIPCCPRKTPPLLHRDKISKNYTTKISLLYKNQEFSYASFPHVFKTIGPLEKILETKNHFFVPFKKVAFSQCRICCRKTIKSDVFFTHFSNIDYIWGKSMFLKIDFLPFISSINILTF